ncbi:MAG: hypothetical protein AB7E96_07905 [Deferribacterales bacterium]
MYQKTVAYIRKFIKNYFRNLMCFFGKCPRKEIVIRYTRDNDGEPSLVVRRVAR